MKNKKETWMLGFNDKGMKEGGKIIMKFFSFCGILFGLLMIIFSFVVGFIIIVCSIVCWICVNKSKTQVNKNKKLKGGVKNDK